MFARARWDRSEPVGKVRRLRSRPCSRPLLPALSAFYYDPAAAILTRHTDAFARFVASPLLRTAVLHSLFPRVVCLEEAITRRLPNLSLSLSAPEINWRIVRDGRPSWEPISGASRQPNAFLDLFLAVDKVLSVLESLAFQYKLVTLKYPKLNSANERTIRTVL